VDVEFSYSQQPAQSGDRKIGKMLVKEIVKPILLDWVFHIRDFNHQQAIA